MRAFHEGPMKLRLFVVNYIPQRQSKSRLFNWELCSTLNPNIFTGFSDLFYKSAGEERTHGLKFIEYLRMRGHKEEDFFTGLKPSEGS